MKVKLGLLAVLAAMLLACGALAECGREADHRYGEMRIIKAPTCQKNGTGEQTCALCGRVKKTKIDRIDHQWGEWTIRREPQGRRRGLRISRCTMCPLEKEDYFYQEGTLYEGMEPCEEVVRMQEKLRDLGFYKGSIRSGEYGDLTTSSVARFQRSVNLEDSGVADPRTLSALDIAWEKATGNVVIRILKPEEMEAAEQAQAMGG